VGAHGSGGKLGSVLVVALAVLTATWVIPPQEAHAAEQRFGGVEMVTADGRLLTGEAAAREYEALRQQPAINCGSCRKFVVIDAEKMRYIARNINMAFKTGKPFILHRIEDKTAIRGNRYKACVGAGFQPNYGGSCDEYPSPAALRAVRARTPRKYRCASRTARATR